MPKTAIIGAARTPFGKLGGGLSPLDATDLGGKAIEAALERAEVKGEEVQHVVFGQVLQAGQGQIPSRQAQIKGGIPKEVSSETVNKVCASGIRSAGMVDQSIRAMNRQLSSPVPQGDGSRARMVNAVMTGDLADNMQRNETEWVVKLLEGGTIDPNSGTADLAGSSCSPGSRPISTLTVPMTVIETTSVRLRPIRSPKWPKRAEPIGRATNAIANVAREASVAEAHRRGGSPR